jgi:hypothetical protein
MGTKVREVSTPKNAGKTNGASIGNLNMDALVLAVQSNMDTNVIYGGNGRPLYDLVAVAGTIKTINTPAKALRGDFKEIKAAIKQGSAAFMVGQFDNYQIAINSSKGVMFAGVLHDSDGKPRTEVDLTLCVVEVNRDFDIPGTDVTIEKGTRFVKALPAEYVGKLQKAA